jgi:uncharacterized protein (DUF169 family)
MDTVLRDKFLELWQKYFPGAAMPVAFYYTDSEKDGTYVKPPKVAHRCVVGDIAKARTGRALRFSDESVGCFGGRKYLGFSEGFRPDFEYFLSYGIPGKLEGERYKKTPRLVKDTMNRMPAFKAPGRYIVFKSWDLLGPDDAPEAVVFFGSPDVISGLFTLANYDEAELGHVLTPFGAGCSTIVQYPYLENQKKKPRCVLGMFDVSARPCVPASDLAFAAPMKKFKRMVANMGESFLVTHSWDMVRKRLRKAAETAEKPHRPS